MSGLGNRAWKALGRYIRVLPAPVSYEREAPAAWPERPAMADAELAALAPHAPGAELLLPARRLLTPYRFDIVAKYLYAKHREEKVECGFALRAYTEHLRVWNGLNELEPVKHGIEAYLQSFHALLDGIEAEGFEARRPAVPVGRGLSPINGGHRVAACLLHDRNVRCKVVDEGLETHNYNYLYFRNRATHVAGGLAPALQNAIALEYCRLKPETYAVLVFPSAVGRHREILAILLSEGHVVYEKEYGLAPSARLNFIRSVYQGEAWLGDAQNGYSGSRAKAAFCFPGEGPLRLFVLEAHDPQAPARAKAAIRALFGLGNHSVHINDDHEETLRVAGALLNANSLHFLEHAQLEPAPGLLERLEVLRGWLREKGLSADDLCIGGSAVLAAYGLREGRDIDFLHHFALPAGDLPAPLGSHNDYAELYGCAPDELIYDPARHFHFAGFKFVSLPVIARMKKARGEKKDRADLRLMRKAL